MSIEIVELYGCPGSGKSTLAAEIFVLFKKSGIVCDLISEKAKKFVWSNKKITLLDQINIGMYQINKENKLLSAKNPPAVIVTDSPVWLNAFYMNYYFNIDVHSDIIKATSNKHNEVRTRLFLCKNGKFSYNKSERFESEKEALKIEKELKIYLDKHKVKINREIEI